MKKYIYNSILGTLVLLSAGYVVEEGDVVVELRATDEMSIEGQVVFDSFTDCVHTRNDLTQKASNETLTTHEGVLLKSIKRGGCGTADLNPPPIPQIENVITSKKLSKVYYTQAEYVAERSAMKSKMLGDGICVSEYRKCIGMLAFEYDRIKSNDCLINFNQEKPIHQIIAEASESCEGSLVEI